MNIYLETIQKYVQRIIYTKVGWSFVSESSSYDNGYTVCGLSKDDELYLLMQCSIRECNLAYTDSKGIVVKRYNKDIPVLSILWKEDVKFEYRKDGLIVIPYITSSSIRERVFTLEHPLFKEKSTAEILRELEEMSKFKQI